MNIEELAACVVSSTAVASKWLCSLEIAMQRFNIDTPMRRAAFLAQIGHESGGLMHVRENLNYTPESLHRTFNGRVLRFTPAECYKYGRTPTQQANQRMIANIAYANRMGNGAPETNDGWNYRGGGPGQLTGRNNYAQCGQAIGYPLLTNPILIEQPDIGSLAFGWFWNEGNRTGSSLNILADKSDINGVSIAINGGGNGLEQRRDLYANALQTLGDTNVRQT